MSPSILYDLSRLATRVLNATPNGIDRIDMLLARHFLTHKSFRTQALGLGFTRPRLMPRDIAIGSVERARAAWREDFHVSHGSPAYEAIVARLAGSAPRNAGRIVAARPDRPLNIAHALVRHLPPRGNRPTQAVPHGAIYLNATHFPLEWPRHVAWLDERKDVRPVFFVHDLLAIDNPQWFWEGEPALHAQRLDLLARRGAAAIVASLSVERSLRDHLAWKGRADLAIFRAQPPVDPVFLAPRAFDQRLEGVSFFLACGTIEPRKNHLLLLRLWRKLVSERGASAPKLVVVGKRGWNNAEIIQALEDRSLSAHVIEVQGLPTPCYKRLLDQCCALLAPSFGEGFGLPVAEAIAAGASVIASDIPPYREQTGGDVAYLPQTSEDAWRDAIIAKTGTSARAGDFARPRQSESNYFEEFDRFLLGLAS